MQLSSNLATVNNADAVMDRARVISNAVGGKLPEDVSTAMAAVNTVRAWSYVPDSDLSVVDSGAPEDIPARLAQMVLSLTAFETAGKVKDTALQVATGRLGRSLLSHSGEWLPILAERYERASEAFRGAYATLPRGSSDDMAALVELGPDAVAAWHACRDSAAELDRLVDVAFLVLAEDKGHAAPQTAMRTGSLDSEGYRAWFNDHDAHPYWLPAEGRYIGGQEPPFGITAPLVNYGAELSLPKSGREFHARLEEFEA